MCKLIIRDFENYKFLEIFLEKFVGKIIFPTSFKFYCKLVDLKLSLILNALADIQNWTPPFTVSLFPISKTELHS